MAKKAFYLIVTLFLTALNGTVLAAPEGGNIVDGSGSIDKQGNKTTVTQNSQNLVVDWDSFNVGKTEHVHFEQQNTTDSALNRIYDSRPSEIWGQLTGKGNIWLLNPNGVIFSKTAKVSTGGLVAAGLWMDSQDFMSGRYVLNNSRGTGDVSNAGVMEAKNIGLAGANINNSGTIRAKAGKVSLASGERITVDFAGDGLMQFVTDSVPEGTSIDHSGSIEAGEVSISIGTANDIYGGVINTTGVITATKANNAGGAIDLVAAEINQNDGSINADGTTGGTVAISADSSVVLSGSISARGNGGLSTEQSSGGSIRATADRTEVTATARIDASGETGGGEVLLGGGWQGKDASIRNAQNTEVQQGASIKANALGAGDGGTIVVWSDNTTTFYGDIEARGGEVSGDGGAAEVSGKEHLLMRGTADLRAPNGNTGKLLLDPGTVRICDGAAAGCTASGMDTFTDDGIQTMLGSANVTIATSNASTGDEDINVDNDVSITWSANTLSLDAGNNINLGGTLNAGTNGTLALTFGNMLSLGSATLSGTITATGDGSSTLAGPAGNTTWAIDDASITVGGVEITLTDVNKLQGGSGVDTFNIDGVYIGSLDGGAGADVFNLNYGGSVSMDIVGGAGLDVFDFNGGTVSGAVVGGADSARLDFADINDALTITLSGTPGATGFSGSVDGDVTVSSFSGVNSITGSASYGDTLVGLDAVSTWLLGASDSYIGGGQIMTFSSLENIQGGSMVDIFTVSGKHTGNLTGGAGADIFILGGAVTGSLSGGTGNDTFNLNAGGIVRGIVYGGADSDTMSYANRSTTVKVAVDSGAGELGFSGGATDTRGFFGIDTIDAGSGGSDRFTGNREGVVSGNRYTVDSHVLTINSFNTINAAPGTTISVEGGDVITTWTITGTITGNRVIETLTDGTERTFTNVGSVQGGSMEDTFNVTEKDTDLSVLLVLNGGAGNDEFNLGAVLYGHINGEAGEDIITFKAGGDIATVNRMGGSVDGGAGVDEFKFKEGAVVTGVLRGGEDSARLDFSDVDSALNIGLLGIPDATGFFGSASGGATVSSFSGVNNIIGGDGVDTLVGSDDTRGYWGLGMSDSYSASSRTLRFSALENMRGGRLNDQFTISGSHTGNIYGGGGQDRFNFYNGASVTGRVYGGTGRDRFDFRNGASVTITEGIYSKDAGLFNFYDDADVTSNIYGGTGLDYFDFNNNASVDGNIYSGAADDFFRFREDGVSVTGKIDGGAGRDTFDYGTTDDLTVVLSGRPDSTGFHGTISGGATVSFDGVDVISGGNSTGTDTLTGLDTDSLWSLEASYSYSTYRVNSGGEALRFRGFESLRGGSGADTFDVNGGGYSSILGGGGADVFNLGASGSVSGMIDGGTGADTLSYSSRSTAVHVTVNTGAAVAGFSGTATDTGGFTGINTVTAGTASDNSFTGNSDGTLSGNEYRVGAHTFMVNGFGTIATTEPDNSMMVIGGNVATTWIITGNRIIKRLTDGTERTYINIRNIQGGSMVDTFEVTGDTVSSVLLTLNGGAGYDVFELGGVLYGQINGEAGADTIKFNSGGDIAAVDGMGGVVDGGAGWDIFEFSEGVVVTGVLRGGAGYARLDFSSVRSALNIGLSDSIIDATGYSGSVSGSVSGGAAVSSFSGVNNIVGGDSGVDTLTGPDNAYAWWTLGVADRYASYAHRVRGSNIRTLSFSALENIRGGKLRDTFDIIGLHTGDIHGGEGNDNFGFRNSANVIGSIYGEEGDNRFDFYNDTSVTGSIHIEGYAGVFFVKDGANVTIDGNIYGGGGRDLFIIFDGGGVTGDIYSGEGNDSFIFRNSGSVTGSIYAGAGHDDFEFSTDVRATITGGIYGGVGDDRFTFWNGASVIGDIYSGKGSDSFSFWNNVTIIGSIYSGVGNDYLHFNLGASVIGSIYGEAGDDHFDFSDGSRVIGSIYGEAGYDLFSFANSASVTGDIDGGAGADTIEFDTTDDLVVVLSGVSDGAGFSGTVSGGAETIFAGVDVITRRPGTNDTLTGLDVGSFWSLESPDGFSTYRANSGGETLRFSGFEVLRGGDGADTFNINGAYNSIAGGGGADVFNLGADGSVRGMIYGGAGTDTLSYATRNTKVQVAVDSGAGALGFSGSATDTRGFFGIDAITAGSGSSDRFTGNREGMVSGNEYTVSSHALTITDFNTINAAPGSTINVRGGDVATTWDITDDTVYEKLGGVTVRTFMDVGSVQGGSMVDTFNITGDTDVSVLLVLNGGAGNDEFNLNAVLYGHINGEAGEDIVTFNTGGDIATVNRVGGSVDGGAGLDVFKFNEGAFVTGVLRGGEDSASLDFSSMRSALDIGLSGLPVTTGFSGSVSGGATVASFSGVNDIVGGRGMEDTLVGSDDTDATWSLGASDSSDSYAARGHTMTFSALEDMRGGRQRDTFNISGSHTGDIYGGAGSDTFNFSEDANITISGNIYGGDAGVIGSSVDIFNFSEDANVTINDGIYSGDRGQFNFYDGANVTGDIHGGASHDIFNFREGARVIINDGIYGRGGNDDFIFYTGASVTITRGIYGEAGDDNFYFGNGASVMTGKIDGGTGTDAFDSGYYGGGITDDLTVVLSGTPDSTGFSGTVSGGAVATFAGVDVITGGSGTNTLTGLNVDSLWSSLGEFNLSAYRVNSGGETLRFRGFDVLRGGSRADTFNITDSYSSIAGGEGADVFNLIGRYGRVSGTIDGGSGYDTLSYASSTATVWVRVDTDPDVAGFSGVAINTGGFDGIDAVTAGTSSYNSFTGNSDGTLSGNRYTVGAYTLMVNGFSNITTADTDNSMRVIGGNVDTIWTITGNMVTEAPTGGTARTLINIVNIQGGSMEDTFMVTGDTDSSVLLTLNGGAGNDVFELRSMLYGQINGEAGADVVRFNSGGDIAAVGGIGGVVDGGAGVDVFELSEGAVVTGMLRGGADYASLDFSSVSRALNIDLSDSFPIVAGFVGSVSGSVSGGAAVTSFSGVNNIVGGGGVDTLVGQDNTISHWTLGETDSYASSNGSGYIITTLTFSALENMHGGRLDNRFIINGSHTGDIYGGEWSNSFHFGNSDSAIIDGSIYGGERYDYFSFGNSANVTITGDIYGGEGNESFSFSNSGSVTITGDIYSGAGDDWFTFFDNASVISDIHGGEGSSRFLFLGGNVTGNIYGGAEYDEFNFNSGSTTITGGIYGMGGADIFVFYNSRVRVTGGIYGGVGNDNFTFIYGASSMTGSIYGSAGDDNFTFRGVNNVTGEIDGGAGTDTFDFGTSSSMAVALSGVSEGSGFSGTFSGRTETTFAGVDVITKRYGTNTLTGLDVDSLWSLEGSNGFNSYRVNSDGQTLRFLGFQTLTGGSGADTFDINGAYSSIAGSGGADVFNLGAGGSVSGMIDGGAGTDVLSYATRNTMVQVTVNTGAAVAGFSGTTTDTGGFIGIDAVTAGTATDDSFTGNSDGVLSGNIYTTGGRALTIDGFETLSVPNISGGNVATTWVITGNTITETPTGGTARTYNDVVNIQGGSMVDTFEVTGDTSSSVLLTLNGGGGDDVFKLDSMLYGQINGEGGADTVRFNSGGGIARVGAMGGGVDGGAGLDVFDFNGGTVAGSVVGGADSASLDFAGVSGTLNIGLSGTPGTDGFSGSVSGGVTVSSFSGISSITGGASGDDTLAGLDATATWTLGASDSYESNSQTLVFSALENMQGGSEVDTFTIDGSHFGNLYGGAGEDSFNLASRVNVTITGGIYGDGDGDSFSIVNSYNVTIDGGIYGNGDGDSFSIVNSDYVTIGGIYGNGGGDSFSIVYSDDVTITGGIHGGDGIDNFSFDNSNMTGRIDGGVGADSFDFRAYFGLTDGIDGGVGADVFNFDAGARLNGDIDGGGNDDVFNFDTSASLNGDIDGGAGSDTLNFAGITSALRIVLSGTPDSTGFSGSVSGGVTTVSSFAGVNVITGGSGIDSLTGLNAPSSWVLGSTASTDSYSSGGQSLEFSSLEVFNAGSDTDDFSINRAYTGDIDGGGGDVADRFSIGSGGSVMGSIIGGAGADVFTLDGVVSGFLYGGAGDDVFNMNTGSSVSRNINGNSGDDRFNFEAGSIVYGGVYGGADNDTLDFGSITDGLEVVLFRTPDSDGFSGSARDSARVSFFGVDKIIGGSGTDRILGLDAPSFWDIGWKTNIDRYRTADQSLEFSSFEVFNAGFDTDEFNITRFYDGDIHGGFDYVADTFIVGSGGHVTGSIVGGSGADSFYINAGGRVDGDIIGSYGNDNFTFNGGTVSGTVSGGVGSDTLSFSSITDALRIDLSGITDSADGDGFSGDVSGGVVTSFSGISSITGGMNDGDSLSGLNAISDWTLGGASDSYATGGQSLMFSALEIMQGGAMADSFIINRAHTGNIMGGAGADVFTLTGAVSGSLSGEGGGDTFNLNDGGSVSMSISGDAGDDVFDFNGGTVMGTVAGGADSDSLDFADIGTALKVKLTSLSTATGSEGFDGDVSGGAAVRFSGVNVITGGSGTDSLAGLDVISTWSLQSSVAFNTYRENSGSETLRFLGFEVLTGGSGVDTFEVTGDTASSVLLTLNGGGGADMFRLGGMLYGQINGEAGVDEVVFNAGGGIAAVGMMGGGVDGGANSAKLNFSSISDTLTITLGGTPGATGYGGSVGVGAGAGATSFSFSGVNSITGGADAGDTLVGIAAAATWTLGTTDTYSSDDAAGIRRTLEFSALETMRGGSMADSFTVNRAHSGNIMGGAGADTFTLAGAVTGSLSGEGGGDTFNLNSGSSVDGNISGGDGVDTFNLNGGTVTGTVDGGIDSASLNFSNISDTLTITLGGTPDATGFGGSVDTGAGSVTFSFSSVNSITGGMGNGDTLAGLDAEAIWTLGASDSYVSNDDSNIKRTLKFSALENMQGGSAVDIFNVGGVHYGNLIGGDNADHFDLFSGSSVTGDIIGGDGNNGFNLNSGSSFTGNIIGGNNGNFFHLHSDNITGNITGGDGVDYFNLFPDSRVDGNITGGGNGDNFSLYSGNITGNITGDGGSDTFRFYGGSAIGGKLTGGAGHDIMSYEFNGGAMVTVAVAEGSSMEGFSGTATDAGRFEGINAITAGAGADIYDSFTGKNDGVLSGNSYTVGDYDLAISGFETLSVPNVGGGDVATTWTITGTTGATGNTVTEAPTGGTARTLINVVSVQGSSSGDTFDVTGDTVSSVLLTLNGGGGNDEFRLNGMLYGQVNGGGGNDTVIFSPGGGVAKVGDMGGGVAGGADSDTLNFSGISAALTVELSRLSIVPDDGFDGDVSDGVTLSFTGVNIITGGSRTDSLKGFDAVADWTLGVSDIPDSSDSYVTGGQTLKFSALEDIQGGDMADTFAIVGAHTGNIMGGDGADIFTLTGAVTGSLYGEEGTDTFTLNSGGSVSMGINGGVDDDSLNFAGIRDALTITLGDTPGGAGFSGSVGIGAGAGSTSFSFSGVNSITGGAGAGDTLVGIAAAAIWTLDTTDTYSSDDAAGIRRTLEFSRAGNHTGWCHGRFFYC